MRWRCVRRRSQGIDVWEIGNEVERIKGEVEQLERRLLLQRFAV